MRRSSWPRSQPLLAEGWAGQSFNQPEVRLRVRILGLRFRACLLPLRSFPRRPAVKQAAGGLCFWASGEKCGSKDTSWAATTKGRGAGKGHATRGATGTRDCVLLASYVASLPITCLRRAGRPRRAHLRKVFMVRREGGPWDKKFVRENLLACVVQFKICPDRLWVCLRKTRAADMHV